MRLARYIERDPRKFQEKITYLCANSEFNKDVKTLRKVWKVSITKDRTKSNAIMERLLRDQDFDKAILTLRNEHALNKHWEDWLYKYVIYNESRSYYDPDASIIEQDWEDFLIRISDSTTLDDVKKAFRFIKREQGTAGKRSRLKKNLERDALINKLAMSGASIAEIYQAMKKEGLDLDFGLIKTIVSRFKIASKNKGLKKLRTSKVTYKQLLS